MDDLNKELKRIHGVLTELTIAAVEKELSQPTIQDSYTRSGTYSPDGFSVHFYLESSDPPAVYSSIVYGAIKYMDLSRVCFSLATAFHSLGLGIFLVKNGWVPSEPEADDFVYELMHPKHGKHRVYDALAITFEQICSKG
jgi:hypothetical protein